MASKPFQIPWKFIPDSDEPTITPKSQPCNKSISNKTFAQALNNVCNDRCLASAPKTIEVVKISFPR